MSHQVISFLFMTIWSDNRRLHAGVFCELTLFYETGLDGLKIVECYKMEIWKNFINFVSEGEDCILISPDYASTVFLYFSGN